MMLGTYNVKSLGVLRTIAEKLLIFSLSTASNSRHHAKYRQNCYPSTGNVGMISLRYELLICFVVVSSYLRLCSVGLCVCARARFVLLQSHLTHENKKPTCYQHFRTCKRFRK